MEVFSIRTRAAIEISVNDFGTDIDKTIYYEWAQANPQTRSLTSEPADDGKGPMPDILRETIIGCLRRRYEFLRQQSHSPLITQNEITEIAARMGHLYRIARWLSPGLSGWPSRF